MSEQTWKRQKYETWDEAFRGLAPVIRQQSVRVADYTRALYVAAVELGFGTDTRAYAGRMRGEYADLAYKCGIYHQLGKALVPPEYQIRQDGFSEEEETVYRKYTTDGRLLVAALQEKGAKQREKRRAAGGEAATDNVPFLMLRECCEQHMERYDGSGYPKGLKGKEISPIAQLVGLAKELDRLASETESEAPFEFAINTLKQGASREWSAALLSVLTSAEEECRSIYTKYIGYTRALPETIPLVEKRADRPMGLRYRPMVADAHGAARMYEAVPWFGGVLGQPDETESAEELRELFVRTSLVEPLSWYFIYEATDTLLRMQNCRIATEGILLEMLPEFYTLKTQLQKFKQLLVDQPIEKEKLWLTLPAEVLRGANKTQRELIRRYTRLGIRLVLDGYRPEEAPTELLRELGIAAVRFDPALYLRRDTAWKMAQLMADGITVLGGGADNDDLLTWLTACGVFCSSGTLTGALVDEEGLILDLLARKPALR